MPINGTNQTEAHISACIETLRADAEALPWTERRSMVQTAATMVKEQGVFQTAIELFSLLAGDSKWEVRQAVADSLLLIPDDYFPRIASLLAEDSNTFVRKAAQRAIDRNRRGQISHQTRIHEFEQIQGQHEKFRKTYGEQAAIQAMAMAENLYDLMVGATVHDMRNIVAVLKSTTIAALAHLEGSSINRGFLKSQLEKLRNQTDYLERLLGDMRTYAQVTPAGRRLESLSDMIHEAREIVLGSFKAASRDISEISLTISVPENIALKVARYQIVLALTNVLKNAFEAYAKSPTVFTAGTIEISARYADEENVEIIIKDYGMGLSTEELEDVRRFIPGGTSKKTYGTGFGLPIAKRKIADHGGSLVINSKEDEGTTVTILLPRGTEVLNEV